MRSECEREGGFTLLELLIAAVLTAVIASSLAIAWRYMSGAMFAVRDRSRAGVDLHLAAEYLTHDLAAATAVTKEGMHLRITRKPALAALEGTMRSGEDAGLEYRLDGPRLVRHDLGQSTFVVVTDGITQFAISEEPGNEMHIAVAAGDGSSERSLVLVWGNP